jgi:hypothetical protein
MNNAICPGSPEANVRVRVGTTIVQIERERARIRAIVPVATAQKSGVCRYTPRGL